MVYDAKAFHMWVFMILYTSPNRIHISSSRISSASYASQGSSSLTHS